MGLASRGTRTRMSTDMFQSAGRQLRHSREFSSRKEALCFTAAVVTVCFRLRGRGTMSQHTSVYVGRQTMFTVVPLV